MLENLVPTFASSFSSVRSWGARALTIAAFGALASVAGCAPATAGGDNAGDEASNSLNGVNLCAGQPANTFQCVDDTNFQHCTGGDGFALKACGAKGLCATRKNTAENPCIGRAAAAAADGVEPPTPGQANPPPAEEEENDGDDDVVVDNGGDDVVVDDGDDDVVVDNGGNNGGGNNGGACVGGPAFDPAGTKNVGNGAGVQFIGGQCLSSADCASGCCALPCGICSGVGAQFQAGKQGCGFGD